MVSGVLNGVVNGPSSSTVTATFNPPPNGMFSLGGTDNGTAGFSLPTSTLLLAPSTSNNGTTSAQGLVTLDRRSPVPEPSTIALFLTTVGGLGLRRYVLSRRRSARV